MPFNITNFNAEVAKTGIASTSQFEAVITSGPFSYSNSNGPISPLSQVLGKFGLDQGMRFRIESLNLPGRTLTTLDQNYHGPARAIPYRFTQQPVSMTIILSRDMRERELFMRWQDFFVGHYRTNIFRQTSSSMFDTKYYQDGIGTIKILQYSIPIPGIPRSENDAENRGDPANNYQLQTEILLEEAYPISVHDIAMSWGDEGYGKLQVEIKYLHSIELNYSIPDTVTVSGEAKPVPEWFNYDSKNRNIG